MLQDLRFGLRIFRRNPAFAAVAVFTLALGIGATTLIFSIARALLYDAFPYRDADRITLPFVHELRPGGYSGVTEFSAASFAEYARGSHAMEGVIGFHQAEFAYRSAEGQQQIPGAWVTPNTVAFLGVPPLYGHGDGCVVSYRFWKEQLGGDPKAVGATILLDGKPRIVTGVMPPRFTFLGASVWIPEGSNYMLAMGRLKPGVSLPAATQEFDAVQHRMAQLFPRLYPNQNFRVSLETLPENAVGHFRTVLFTLLAAVALLLLIACANVANLLLARATAREREIAIRTAVGATRWRLVRQLLLESAMLAAAAAAAGCLLARWIIAAAARLIPRASIPGEAVIAMEPVALAFACTVTLAVTLLCGLAPAMAATRIRAGERRSQRLRSALVVAEVALSVVLLTGAGLMIRTFLSLTHVNLGFDAANLLHARLALPRGRYRDETTQRNLLRDVLRRVEGLPGVASATFSLEDTAISGGPDAQFDGGTAALGACDENYFRTMGRPIVRGAAFTRSDIDRAAHNAVVNEAFVRAYFPGQDPLGRSIHFHTEHWMDAPDNADFVISGVVSDARNHGLREAVRPQIYLAYTALHIPPVGIMIRTRTAPLSLVEAVRRQVWAIDPEVALTKIGTVQGSIGETYYAEPRFALAAMGGFGALGLLLVAIGVFSIMAYSVSTRTREIGVRMALGAQPEQVLAGVMRGALMLLGSGIACGLAASLALARLISSLLWGVAPNDPATFLAVAGTVLTAGLAACAIPARRAAQVDPAQALRSV